MGISERQQKILAFIVEYYVANAQPCGSNQIAEGAGLDVSPATIRNEMASLLEMGLLVQPHTSAGRIPSKDGYKHYVGYMMEKYKLQNETTKKMQDFMSDRVTELEKIIVEAGKFISDVTCYPTLATAPKLSMQNISRFEIMPMDSRSFVLIIKTSNGLTKTKLCKISESVSPKILKQVCKVLNDRLTAVPIPMITVAMLARLEQELSHHDYVLPPIIKFITDCAKDWSEPEIVLDGERKLLSYPEFKDSEKAFAFTEFLHDKEALAELITMSYNSDSIVISIGDDNTNEALKDAGVIIGNYKLGEKTVGAIAIIGPMRMDYAKVATQLEYFTVELNKLLSEMFGSEKLLGGRTIESE